MNQLKTSSLLGLIFVFLKLTHLIEWSWWFITMPFYALPAAGVVVVIAAAAFCVFVSVTLFLVDRFLARWRRRRSTRLKASAEPHFTKKEIRTAIADPRFTRDELVSARIGRSIEWIRRRDRK